VLTFLKARTSIFRAPSPVHSLPGKGALQAKRTVNSAELLKRHVKANLVTFR
jgi:hypothetical protein